MNDKVYLNLPNLPELRRVLTPLFPIVYAITSADVIITEEAHDFLTDKLVIQISSNPSESGKTLQLSSKLPIDTLVEVIKSSILTAHILKNNNNPLNIYSVQTPRVEYFINKLENILNAAPESILEIDATGAILFHNVKFSQIYDPEQPVIDDNIFDIFDRETSEYLKQYMSWESMERNSEFIGKLVKKNGTTINIAGHITALQDDNYHFEIIFDDITSKIAKIQKIKKIEEQSIVAGFSRHLSHNVMNALTAAGGFIRQIKAKTESDLHTQNLWRIIDEKLSLIEEVVTGYNDYTHSTTLMTNDSLELFGFFKTLIVEIAEKRIDRNFSAYLYKFKDFYTLTYDFSNGAPFGCRANKMFLKLAVCYILKDCIRYFGNDKLNCNVFITQIDNGFSVIINILGVDVPDNIVDSMFRPWDHQIFSQSFDYWGIVIAGTIMEKHNGKFKISKTANGLRFALEFIEHN